jgi:DNA-binding winged helix-turn-helix (wHTH) protein/TolB-like protein/Tfp pilus assembly protein PilF
MPHDSKELLEFGPFRLDVAERQLFRGDTPVAVTAKAFEVLLLLVRNAGRTVTKEEFMDTVWAGTVVEESNLSDNISTLRQALGDDAREPRYIRTVPKRGYRFLAPVQQTAGAAGFSPPDKEKVVRSGGLRPAVPLILAAIAIVGLAASAFFWQRQRTAAAPAPLRSVAVLPFVPLDADSGNTHLGVSLADSLITHLTSIDELVVRPPSAMLGYANAKQDSIAAAREQNVDAFVEGRIRKRGNRVRITVQLVSVREARTLWARTFDEDASNLFAVEDRIAEEVARTLAVRFDGSRAHHTPDPAAYELYGAGRYLWTQRTPDELQQSVEHFAKAIELDPRFAHAHAGLADAWSAIGMWNFQSPGEAFPRAKAAALAALALDPELAEARTSLAYVKFRYDWDLAGADADFRRALELRPNSASAHVLYAEYLTVMQRHEEAANHLQKARALDPRSSYVAMMFAARHYFMRDYARAAAELETLLDRDPGFFIGREFLWAVYREAGDEQRSLAARWETLRPYAVEPAALQSLQDVHRRSGIQAYRRAENEFLQTHARRQYVPPVFLAMNFAQNGDAASALPWLEKAYAERSGWLLELRVDPVWDKIRNDPAFVAFSRKVFS